MNKLGKAIFNLALAGTFLLAAFGQVVPVRAASTWYLSAYGDDANDCATPATPCKTFSTVYAKTGAGDTIDVAQGTYTFSGGNPYDVVAFVDQSLTISGGWNSLFTARIGRSTFDGQNYYGCFITQFGQSVIYMDRLIVQNCGSGYSFYAGVSNYAATLTITNTWIMNNKSEYGAGVYNHSGLLSIYSSWIGNNVSDNAPGGYSRGDGGGIFNAEGEMFINNSTIADNTADRGGGIFNGGTLHLNNVTIAGNTATTKGGGIFNISPLTNFPGVVTIQNSIIAGNGGQADSPDCWGVLQSGGYILLQQTTGCTVSNSLDGYLPGIDPLMLPPNASQKYYRLPSNSPAVNAGNPAGCKDSQGNLLTTDQRGAPRSGRCDIGAYEYTLPGPIGFLEMTSGDTQSVGIQQTFAVPLQVRAWDAYNTPLAGQSVTLTAPSDGPSGTFPPSGLHSITVTTDENGFTPTVPFFANGTAGSYTVTASSGASVSTEFALTNLHTIFLPMLKRGDPWGVMDEFPFTDRCASFTIPAYGHDAARVTQCVYRVRLLENHYMYFDMRWTVEFLTNDFDNIYKNSDENNPNMYITDAAGNHYNHIATGGAAATTTYFYRVGGPNSAEGWFLFAPAPFDQNTFTFHDDDQGLLIGNIILIH
jgi:hypothetical protein